MRCLVGQLLPKPRNIPLRQSIIGNRLTEHHPPPICLPHSLFTNGRIW